MKKTIIGAVVALLFSLLIYQPSLLEVIKLRTFDALVQTQEPTGNLVVLNLTEDDIHQEGGWPFPRQRLAEIHVDLLNAGAVSVSWVAVFSEPDRFGGDAAFAEALSYNPSVIAMFETDGFKDTPKTEGTVILGDDVGGIQAQGVTQNIKPLRDVALQGIVSAPVDVDNLLRRMPLLMRSPDGWLASFGTQLLKAATSTSTYVIKTNANGIQEVRVKQLNPIPTDSDGRVWVNWINTDSTSLTEMDVAGKMVIIGTTAKGILPQVATPIGLVYPHQIQASLLETILHASNKPMPQIPQSALLYEILIFAVGVLLVFIFINYLGVYVGLALSVASITAMGAFGVYLIQRGILIDVTWAMISQFVVAAATFYLNYKEQYKLRQLIKKQFEHYLDPRQVKRLQDNPGLLKLGGEKRYCTFLFTDVRGFTALSERVSPEEVAYIMNRALTAQQSAVAECHGMVDKYIGDAMMAIFGAPLDLDNHEDWAIKCAKQIQINMEELNKQFTAKGLPPIQIGIGINSGDAIIGNMGSDQRFDYTAIGDAVNIAARLESGTKAAEVDVLIGISTKQRSGSSLKELPPIEAKGKTEKLNVFTLT
ncbi:MAG: adenylate cyclase [Porticoccaceae bacterium]|jgi:adenylate cyclase